MDAIGCRNEKGDHSEFAKIFRATLNAAKLRFAGTTITGFLDREQVVTTTNTLFSRGMVGLVMGDRKTRNTAYFDERTSFHAISWRLNSQKNAAICDVLRREAELRVKKVAASHSMARFIIFDKSEHATE